MKRQVSLDEISDGRLYGLNDMAKADCGGCGGCSACCRNMGKSVILDPYDVCRLANGLDTSFEELLKEKLELSMVDGAVLPNLKMAGPEEKCGFLNGEGRCRVHPFRPGICRLFPLGRYYENGDFRYFLQLHECRKESRFKVKIKKWIDTPDTARYDAYIRDWHYFVEAVQEKVSVAGTNEEAREVTLYILKNFYLIPYGDGEFYPDFYRRLEAGRVFLGKALV